MPPGALFWPDKARQWQGATESLRNCRRVLTLGSHQPEVGGPGVTGFAASSQALWGSMDLTAFPSCTSLVFPRRSAVRGSR